MKKFYFLMLAMIVSFAAQAWTVKFQAPNDWANVNVWAWGGNDVYGGSTVSWPGAPMTYDESEVLWTYSSNGDAPTQLLFNYQGDAHKTGDFEFIEGATYNTDGVVGGGTTEPVDPDPYEPENHSIVYFENSDNWANVYAYNWQSSQPSNSNHAWPGVLISANTKEFTVKGSTETKTLYYYTITDAKEDAIIFNGGNDKPQTKDLKVVNGAVYSGTANNKNGGTIQAIGNIVDGEFVEAGYVETEKATIYFPVSTYNVNKAYLYTWGPQLTADWPGTELTKETVNEVEYWVFTVSADEIENTTVDGMQLNTGNNDRKVELKNVQLKDGDVVDIQSGVLGNIETYVPVDPNAPAYYLVGTIFENNVEGSEIRKALVDETATEDYWTWTGTVVPGLFYILKVENGVETKYVASDEPHITGTCVVDCVVDNDPSATEEFNLNAQGTYTFVFNPEAMTLTATVEGDVEPVNYAQWDVEVRGSFNSWGENVKHPNAKGIVTFSQVAVGNGEFKIVLRNGTSPQEWLSTGGAVAMNEELVLYHEDANMTISGATAGQKFDITIDVVHNRMIVVSKADKAFLVINGTSFEMTDNGDGTYEVEETVAEGDEVSFIYDGKVYNFTSGKPLEGSTASERIFDLEEGNVAPVYLAGTLVFKADFTNLKLYLSGTFTTSIDTIAADETEAVYFNLQGIRVENPANGIFIRRQGNKATKVLVK